MGQNKSIRFEPLGRETGIRKLDWPREISTNVCRPPKTVPVTPPPYARCWLNEKRKVDKVKGEHSLQPVYWL